MVNEVSVSCSWRKPVPLVLMTASIRALKCRGRASSCLMMAASLSSAPSDLSESGAQVRLPLGIAVPEHFHLVTSIPRLAYACVMAWRKPLVCGVRFAAQHRLDAPPVGQENFAQTCRDHKSRRA